MRGEQILPVNYHHHYAEHSSFHTSTSFCGRKCLRHFYRSLNLVVPSINWDLAISLWIIHRLYPIYIYPRLMSHLLLPFPLTSHIGSHTNSVAVFFFFFRAGGELGLTGFLVSSVPRPISGINGKKVVGYRSYVTEPLCGY